MQICIHIKKLIALLNYKRIYICPSSDEVLKGNCVRINRWEKNRTSMFFKGNVLNNEFRLIYQSKLHILASKCQKNVFVFFSFSSTLHLAIEWMLCWTRRVYNFMYLNSVVDKETIKINDQTISFEAVKSRINFLWKVIHITITNYINNYIGRYPAIPLPSPLFSVMTYKKSFFSFKNSIFLQFPCAFTCLTIL